MEEVITPSANGKSRGWLKVLGIGFVFYFLSLAVLVFTENPNLFPTVVLLGNFLVPVTYVAFFYERRHMSKLSMPTTAFTFIYGGLLGVLASAMLEPIFIRRMDVATVLLVGIIEEGAKILGVYLIARRWKHDSEMDGLILGAAVGMGFAALESMGYTFMAFLQSQGSLSAIVSTTMLRGILSPIGHGTWTAILASVLFRESKAKRFRINAKVIGAYLLVSLLHAVWDGLPTYITPLLSTGPDVFVSQTLIGATGFVILWLRWREGRRLQNEQQPVTAPEEDQFAV